MTEIICRPAENRAELEECFLIRKKIFVDEQGLFTETDQDEHDAEAIHIVALYKDKIIGTVRIYEQKDSIWWGGRLAVEKKLRGRAGRLLVQKAVKIIRGSNAKCFRAYIQLKNVSFFKNLKWKPIGEKVFLHGKPHLLMEAEIK